MKLEDCMLPKTLNDYYGSIVTQSNEPIRLSKFNQDIIGMITSDGFLSWSLLLQAPIAEINYHSSAVNLSEMPLLNGGKPICLSSSSNIEIILKDNKAGPNGESLTLKEILKLYKGESNDTK